MKSFDIFKERVADLKARLEDEKKYAASAIVEEMRICIREFGIKPEDIFSAEELRKSRSRSPKYYDPVSGSTWSGVGREPLWIRGKDRSLFELPVVDGKRFILTGENDR